MQNTPTRQARHKIPSRRRKYVLTGGTAVCGKCSGHLQAQPVKAGRSYQCVDCGGIRIMAEALESYVAARVLSRLAAPAGRDKLHDAFEMYSDTETLVDRVAALRAQLGELAADYRSPDGLSLAAFKAADREINTEIDELVAYMDRVDKLAPLSTATTARQLADWWEKESTIDQRHALVVTIVERVVVHPAPARCNTVNTDRVDVEFR